MVYALVGLTNARDDPRMQIDYSQSVRQVYISVVDYVLKREVKLDVMSFVGSLLQKTFIVFLRGHRT
jgi:hypothetical protein